LTLEFLRLGTETHSYLRLYHGTQDDDLNKYKNETEEGAVP